MNNNTVSASYTKLQSGDWGIRVSGTVAPGAAVTVTKKDGTTKVETVHQVLWSGADKFRPGQTVTLCSVTPSAPSRRYVGCAPARRDSRRECEECGDFVVSGTRCWETGLTH